MWRILGTRRYISWRSSTQVPSSIGSFTLSTLTSRSSGHVQDISLSQVRETNAFAICLQGLIPTLSQWLALTPPALVKAHLDLDDATINKLSKTKPVIVGS